MYKDVLVSLIGHMSNVKDVCGTYTQLTTELRGRVSLNGPAICKGFAQGRNKDVLSAFSVPRPLDKSWF